MAEIRNPSEPSMEEILASIRRIIVEDNGPRNADSPNQPTVIQPGARNAGIAPASRGGGIADPFRVAGADPSIRPFPAAPPNMAAAQPNRVPPVQEAILDLTDRIDDDDLKSPSRAALTKIASIGQASRQSELPLGDAGRTLEEMVRELLRPPLKEWLDANLPRLVERLVRDEINRLVREAQER